MIQITDASWQKQVLDGPWVLENRFDVDVSGGMVKDITVNPNGDVAIISTGYSFHRGQVCVYSKQGVCKGSMDRIGYLRQITTNSDGSIYFVTNDTHVQMYSADCKYIGEWESACPHASSHASSDLYGLAVDANDNVYVGKYDWPKCCVHKHKQSGSFISCIKVSITPLYLAVTSQDTIIVCSGEDHPQIVSNTGEVLHTINHPTGESLWDVDNVHCYRDSIFITMNDEISCYYVSGKYLGKLPIHDVRPNCLAMIGDDRLVIGDGSRQCSIYSLQK